MLFGGLASTSSSTKNTSNKRRKRRQFYIADPNNRYSLSADNSSLTRTPAYSRHASLSPTALSSIANRDLSEHSPRTCESV